MINVTLVADFTEMDRVMGRLMGAMDEGRIHRTASKVAKTLIRKEYKERFLKLTSSTTRWQSRKKFMSGGSTGGSGVGPGFLTGTTYNAITEQYDEHMGRVFLAGRWPQGSGRLESQWGHFVEWGAFGLRVKSNPLGSVREYPSEDLATKEYGKWRKEGLIEWLYLDDNNIQTIADVLSTSFDVAVGAVAKGSNAKSETQSVREEAEEARGFHRAGGGALTPSTAEFLKDGFQFEGGAKAKVEPQGVSGPVISLTSEAIAAYEKELLSRSVKARVNMMDVEVNGKVVSHYDPDKDPGISGGKTRVRSGINRDLEDAADSWLKKHGGGK